MDNNPLLGRLMKDKVGDVTHTSVFAEAQNADRIGSASAQSFAARQAIEKSRQTVHRYKDSKVVTDVGEGLAKASKYDANKEANQVAAIKEKFGGERKYGGDTHGAGNNSSLTGSGHTSTPPMRRNPGISW